MGIVRSSSKNLYDNREERKEDRRNAGAAILTGGRGQPTRPPVSGGLNQFNNAPQYARPNQPRQNGVERGRQGSIPMARGPSAERVMRTPGQTGMPGARQSSAGRHQLTNAPFATGGSMNQMRN